jgi:hypothetical protein
LDWLLELLQLAQLLMGQQRAARRLLVPPEAASLAFRCHQ